MRRDLLAWIAGEPTRKLPCKETLNHPEVIRLASGLDPFQQTPQAFRQAYAALGIDLINIAPEENAPPPLRPGEVKSHDDGVMEGYLGVFNTTTRVHFGNNILDKSVDSCYSFTMNKIKTLQQAIIHFSDPDTCLDYLAKLRWPNGKVICPTCGQPDPVFLKNQRKWQCKKVHKKRQFSIKVGTIFEDSPLGLDKWLCAIWMLANCKNGVSSYEIHRALGVTQKSAWFMMHRIRVAMKTGSFLKKLGDGSGGAEIEVDETFIGGKARNMHVDARERRITGRGGKDKTAVMGILERGGEIRAKVVSNRRKKILQKEVKKHVAAGSALYTDALQSYDGLSKDYAHQMINHAEAYVDGRVHTNGLENFWSLLKRGINGTYVSVEPFHLFRYLDEQVFRYNNRKDPMNDGNRFEQVSSQVAGKRLTYAELTGKVGETSF